MVPDITWPVAWSNKVTGLGGFDKFMTTMFAGSQNAAEGDRLCQLAYDPKFATDHVMQPLVHRFRSVKVISDVSQFTTGPYDILVLLDVTFRDKHSAGFGMGLGEKYETGTNINAYFVDRSYALAGKIEVAKKERTSAEAFLKEVIAVRAGSLEQYQRQVAALLGPDPMTNGTATTAPQASVADRLRAVDDLLKQGLITPEQAAHKKTEILQSL